MYYVIYFLVIRLVMAVIISAVMTSVEGKAVTEDGLMANQRCPSLAGSRLSAGGDFLSEEKEEDGRYVNTHKNDTNHTLMKMGRIRMMLATYQWPCVGSSTT